MANQFQTYEKCQPQKCAYIYIWSPPHQRHSYAVLDTHTHKHPHACVLPAIMRLPLCMENDAYKQAATVYKHSWPRDRRSSNHRRPNRLSRNLRFMAWLWRVHGSKIQKLTHLGMSDSSTFDSDAYRVYKQAGLVYAMRLCTCVRSLC